MAQPSYGDLRLDMRVRVVALDGKILEAEREQIGHGPINAQDRQSPRQPGELEARLIEVIEIEVSVAQRVDELAGYETRDLRHRMGQQRIGRDVERHPEENVGGALVELARQLAVRDVELEQA